MLPHRGSIFFSLQIPLHGLCYRPDWDSTCHLGLAGLWNQDLSGASANQILCPDQSSPWGQVGGSAMLFSDASSEGYSVRVVGIWFASFLQGQSRLKKWWSVLPYLVPIVTSHSYFLAFELCYSSPAWCNHPNPPFTRGFSSFFPLGSLSNVWKDEKGLGETLTAVYG